MDTVQSSAPCASHRTPDRPCGLPWHRRATAAGSSSINCTLSSHRCRRTSSEACTLHRETSLRAKRPGGSSLSQPPALGPPPWPSCTPRTVLLSPCGLRSCPDCCTACPAGHMPVHQLQPPGMTVVYRILALSSCPAAVLALMALSTRMCIVCAQAKQQSGAGTLH